MHTKRRSSVCIATAAILVLPLMRVAPTRTKDIKKANFAQVVSKDESFASDFARDVELAPLPMQPAGMHWPRPRDWPTAGSNAALLTAASKLFDEAINDRSHTYGLLVVKGGQIAYERYDSPLAPQMQMHVAWSVCKSLVFAAFGILLRQGRIDLDAPAAVPEWSATDDPRRSISLRMLMQMRSGLEEDPTADYLPELSSAIVDLASTVINHSAPGPHPPGLWYAYGNSGVLILCRILRDLVGGGEVGLKRFLQTELFDPMGIGIGWSLQLGFDQSGTLMGSSLLFATPRTLGKLGLLFLRDGVWDGRRLLPPGWVDFARTPSFSDGNYLGYGALTWLDVRHRSWFYFAGADGQRVLIAPEEDVVIVRLGRGGNMWDFRSVWDDQIAPLVALA